MTDQLTDVDISLRCSAWTRRLHADPIGTAGSYKGFLLVEWPLPWPRDIGMVPELAPVVTALAGTGIRLQALVPAVTGQASTAVLFRADAGDGFGQYVRSQVRAPLADLPAAAVGLLGADADAAAESDADDHGIDVLICTHGRRDRCCGSMGTQLALEMAADEAWRAQGVRVWRTSHTGGHRYAPTAIVLPQGTAWAFATADSLHQVVSATGDLTELLPTYRGCAGVGAPAIQALERAVLAETGWSLFGARRSGRELEDGRVAMDVVGPDGTARWEARVVVSRQVPVPECGEPIESAKKFDRELAVEDLVRLS